MMIWKWLLIQIILDGYPLKEHLIEFNETHILYDDARIVGVKKKNYSHKKQNNVDFEGSIFKIEKMLVESVCNVSASICCANSCCQHFLHEKTLLLK